MLSKPVYTTTGESESCEENLRCFTQNLNICDMTTQRQFLDVEGPDGEKYLIHLQDFVDGEQNLNRVTIGRDNRNDIVLPDPQKNISRRHFTLETEGIYWWVMDGVDNMVSANGTFLWQGDSVSVIDVRNFDRLRLKHGDVISILGKVVEPEQYLFWKLTYHDDDGTHRVEDNDRTEPMELPYIEYSLSQEKLFRVNNRKQEEIRLRPQERCLIHFMATRNHSNNEQPVVCTYEELIEAIWQDPYGRTEADVNQLVFGLRHKLELDSGEPNFIETVRKRGYRLQVKVLR